MIFSQGARPGGRHHRRTARHARAGTSAVGVAVAASAVADPDRQRGQRATAPPAAPPVVRPCGPYDLAEAPAGVARWDVGSLKIPVLPGVQLRVQPGRDGMVRRVILLQGRSALHLVAFAAPRSEPLWDEVRRELSASLVARQAEVDEVVGELGVELRVRVPVADGFKLLRLVGVDGPRWLLRADFHGPAALDPAAAGQLTGCLRGLVVDRGSGPRPVREPLPLRPSGAVVARIRPYPAGRLPALPEPGGS